MIAADDYLSFEAKTNLLSTFPFRAISFWRTFEFKGPVTLGGNFLGYVTVDYDRDVIYEPYFRTRVKVVLIAVAFIIRIDLPDLPPGAEHRLPDPVPPHERERHF